MTKIELYNRILSIAQQTGQGTSGIVEIKIGSELFDELIEDGLIKRVFTRSQEPANTWYCLNDGYCVETDTNGHAYTFIRHYLGNDNDIALNSGVSLLEILEEREETWIKWKNNDMFSDEMKDKKYFTDYCSKMINNYYDWIKTNQHDINITRDMTPLEEIKKILTDDEKEWVKNRPWFNILFLPEKQRVEDLKIKLEKNIEDFIELIDTNKQLIKLYQQLIDVGNKVESSKKEILLEEKDIALTKERIKLLKYFITNINEIDILSLVK